MPTTTGYTYAPSLVPTHSAAPSAAPSVAPTALPSIAPTVGPTASPSTSPTFDPTQSPTVPPTSIMDDHRAPESGVCREEYDLTAHTEPLVVLVQNYRTAFGWLLPSAFRAAGYGWQVRAGDALDASSLPTPVSHPQPRPAPHPPTLIAHSPSPAQRRDRRSSHGLYRKLHV